MAAPAKGPDTVFTTPSDREFAMTRVFDAPRRLVFEAWTSPKHVPHWMLGPEGWSMPVCKIDLRPGGSWHFVWRKGDGTKLEMRGTYREVAPPERIVHTEVWGPEWPETVNTIVFTEEQGKTTMTCTMSFPSRQARDAAMATGMKDGATVSYDRLADYVMKLDRFALR